MGREAAKVGERRCIGIRGMRRGDCQKCTHTDRPPRNLKHKHTNPNSRAWFHSSVLLPRGLSLSSPSPVQLQWSDHAMHCSVP